MSRPSQPSGRASNAVTLRLGVLLERRRGHDVRWEHRLVRERILVAELLGHLPADEHCVRALAEADEHAELVVDLRTARRRARTAARRPPEGGRASRAPARAGAPRTPATARRRRPSRRAPGAQSRTRPARTGLAPPPAAWRSRGRSWSRRRRSGCSRGREPDRPTSSSRRRAATGAISNSGSGPLGRPRCEQTTTSRAPESSRWRSVRSDAWMRVSSATRPSSSGTLRSERTRTLLSATSAVRTERGVCLKEGASRSDRRADTSTPTRCRTSRTP